MRIVTAALALALASAPVSAYEAGDWLLRVGVGGTLNDASSETIGGDEVEASEQVRPAFALSYMVRDDWAVGVRALWSHGQNLYLGDGGSRRLGTVRSTPASVTVEYYLPKVAQARFWLLGGWHYMRLTGDDYRAGAVPGHTRMRAANGSGVMGGVGVDWDRGGKWSWSAAVMASTAKADIVLSGPAGRREYRTEPEPLLWQFGMMRRF